MPGRGANRSADTAAGQPEEDLSASGSQGAPAPPQNGAEKVPDDAPDDEVVGETAEPYDFRCKCGKDETDDGVESQEVVCCDKCSHWGHAECEGYLAQMNEEGAVYQCSVCLDGGCSAEVKFYTASVQKKYEVTVAGPMNGGTFSWYGRDTPSLSQVNHHLVHSVISCIVRSSARVQLQVGIGLIMDDIDTSWDPTTPIGLLALKGRSAGVDNKVRNELQIVDRFVIQTRDAGGKVVG